MKATKSTWIKAVALCLLLALTLPVFIGCSSRPVPASKRGLTPVGVVDGREVYYEELYFLVCSYLPTIQKKHGENTDAIRAELDETVRQHIVTNYAMLRLCENEGLVYDENDDQLKDAEQAYVDSLIENEFDGSRKAYLADLEAIGMTDHYLRFNARVDALYNKLPSLYGERGLIPTEDEAIRKYVKENFVRTWHIAILVEEDESYEENKKKAEEALAQLQGEKTMYDMIGSKYNEDFTLFTTDGYYFPRGTMEKVYEDTAFSLDIGEMSGIVESTGNSNKTGNSVPCFYIMERLEPEDAYINTHLTELADQCANAQIATKLSELTESLRFVPNDDYRALDLTALEAPGNGADVTLILIIGGITVAVAAVATTIVLLVLRKRKAKALVLKKQK